jgi:hypothetical protein
MQKSAVFPLMDYLHPSLAGLKENWSRLATGSEEEYVGRAIYPSMGLK